MAKVKPGVGAEGDLRTDENRHVWMSTGRKWVRIENENGIPVDLRYAKEFHGQAIQRFTAEELKDANRERTQAERYLDLLEELTATGKNERLHILDRIDAFLEQALLAHRDPTLWMSSVRAARQLIEDDLNK